MQNNYAVRSILEIMFVERSRRSLRNCREDDSEVSEHSRSGRNEASVGPEPRVVWSGLEGGESRTRTEAMRRHQLILSWTELSVKLS